MDTPEFEPLPTLPAALVAAVRAVLPVAPADRKFRAAIYSRYSVHEDRDSSSERQIGACRADAARLNAVVVEVYDDPQLSGAFMHDRPGLIRMLEDARAGAFDILVIEDVDRLGRDVADLTAMWRELRNLGIKIHAVMRGEVDLLTITVVGFLSAEQRRQLSIRMQGGRNIKAARGLAVSGPIYGYEGVPGQPGVIRKSPTEAPVVERIFRLAFDGVGPSQIVEILNRDGVPSPSGRTWNRRAIWCTDPRRFGILQNPRYAGLGVYRRTLNGRRPGTGKSFCELRDPDEWILSHVPKHAIVDRTTWDAANAAGPPLRPRTVRRRAKHVLGLLLHCGCCGSRMTATWHLGETRFVCSNRRARKGCEGKGSLYARHLNAAVLRHLAAEMRGPEAEAAFSNACREAWADLEAGLDRERRSLDREIEGLMIQLDRSFDAAATDGYSSDWIAGKRRRLTARLEEVRAKRAGLTARLRGPALRLDAELEALFRSDQAGNLEDVEEVMAALAGCFVRIGFFTLDGRTGRRLELTARGGRLTILEL